MSTMPPTVGTGLPPKQSTWPTVIGIIAIVFGSLAALQGCFGAVMSAIMRPLARKIEGSMPEGQATGMEAIVQFAPWLVAGSIVAVCLAVILLVGGVMVTRRRPGAVKVCLTWATLKMLYAVPYSLLQYHINKVQFEALQNDPNMPAGGAMTRLFDMIGIFAVVFGLLWLWALPVFMFIWFGRSRIREEIAGWDGGAGLPAPPAGDAPFAPPADPPWNAPDSTER
jgi:hypothetical protein